MFAEKKKKTNNCIYENLQRVYKVRTPIYYHLQLYNTKTFIMCWPVFPRPVGHPVYLNFKFLSIYLF